MVNQKLRRIFAGTGWLMVTVSATALGIKLGSGEWALNHDVLLNRAILASAACSIVMAVLYFTTEDSKHPPKGAASIGRDNYGTQIGGPVFGTDALKEILKATTTSSYATSRLYIHSAEYASIDDPKRFRIVTDCLRQLIVDDQLLLEVQNHNFVAGGINFVPKDFHTGHRKKLSVVYSFDKGPLQAIAAMEESTLKLPQTSSPLPKKSLPELKLAFSGGNLEVLDYMVRFVDHGGERCHSIIVHNESAEEGGEARRADSLSARITFTHPKSSRTTFADRACWIGEGESEIYLHPGDTAHLLFGIHRDGEWVTFTNPNKYPSGGWPSSVLNLNETKFPLFPNMKMIGEISVIEHKAAAAVTLVKRRFVMAIGESTRFLNVGWEDEG